MIEYSISRDIESGTLDAAKLQNEITVARCVNGLGGITASGDSLLIECGEVVDRSALDAVVAAHVAVSLGDRKAMRVLDVDARTRAIIAGGFSFDGQRFSLSYQAQTNWISLAALKDILTFPINVTTNTDTSYSMTADKVPSFLGAGAYVVASAIGSGRTLKIAINAASTQDDLDAVVDTR